MLGVLHPEFLLFGLLFSLELLFFFPFFPGKQDLQLIFHGALSYSPIVDLCSDEMMFICTCYLPEKESQEEQSV